MRTLEQMSLLEATRLARSLGYEIRTDWMDGCGGGEVCVDRERWIFLDDMQPADEQLNALLRILRNDPRVTANNQFPRAAMSVHRRAA